jgi:hypothetical protein
MTHSLMRNYGYPWNDIEPTLKKLAKNRKKEKE